MTRHNDILDLGSWCILRCANADTLPVFESLKRAGIEAYAPIDKRTGRKPRTKAQYVKSVALMPSYVFAHVRHLNDLARLATLPTSPHPRFSIFKQQGGFGLVADDELAALRAEEGRKLGVFERLSRRGRKGPRLAVGSEVRLPDGPFAGFSGIVGEVQGQFTLVDTTIFGKPITIKIASFLLHPSAVDDVQSDLGIAA